MYGHFRIVERHRDYPRVFAFLRTFGTATAVVLLNFGQDEVTSVDDDTVGFAGPALDNYRDPSAYTQLNREVLQGTVVDREKSS